MSYNQTANTKITFAVTALSIVVVAAAVITGIALAKPDNTDTIKRKSRQTKTRSQSSLKVENSSGGLQQGAGGTQGGISPSQNNFTGQ